jgi:uncharacterized protein YbjT (DUF2867 family)
MRILLLGGTGRTGRLILEEALARGIEVSALVRDAERLGRTDALIYEGSPYDPGQIERAIDDCEAVVSALNVSRRSDNPFSRLRAPRDLMSRSIGHAIEAMNEHGLRRIAVISSLGVGDSRPRMPALFRGIMALTNIRHAMRDHERQERLLMESGLDWTVVRPALLNDGEPGELRVALTLDEPLGGRTSRRAVARFLVQVVEEGRYIGQALSISDG